MKILLDRFKRLLAYPAVKDLNVDDPGTNIILLEIIQKNIFLRRIYEHWYKELADLLPVNLPGPVLELGSGAGFMKRYIPDLITSEILTLPHVDLVLDAHHLPFADASLRALVMVDVLHHLPRIRDFLSEAGRCVKPGGAIAMIEPWHTPFSAFIYRYFHHEPFDPDTKNWHFPKGGPLSAANSALPWILFDRDRNIFETDFPLWQIKGIRLHTPFSYLISGGMAMRPLVPEQCFDFIRKLETRLTPQMNSIAMFSTILLERKRTAAQ